jgi:hypothetical protein
MGRKFAQCGHPGGGDDFANTLKTIGRNIIYQWFCPISANLSTYNA